MDSQSTRALTVVVPSAAERRDIQACERAFYWSGCLEGFLRKHGIINVGTAELGAADGGLALVCRNGRRMPDADAAIYEGPLHPDVAAALGLVARAGAGDRLAVSGPDGRAEPLSYPFCQTRRIPGRGEKRPDPQPYRPADARWANRAIRYQTFEAHCDWETLLRLQGPDGEWLPAGLRRGSLVVLGIPLFDLVSSAMAFPPLADGYWNILSAPPAPSVELWLVETILSAARQGGVPVVRVGPWPEGHDWALTVRHDWDRQIGLFSLWSLLRFYRQHGIRASFGVIEGRTPARHIQMVARAGHEVNVHSAASSHAEFERERTALSTLTGRRVKGYHCHGGGGGIGYLGDTQFEWAEQAGLSYVEMLGRMPFQPTPIARLEDDLPALTRLVAPSVHCSLDAGMGPHMHNLDFVLRTAQRIRNLGGQLVVMNHPDIHIRELKQIVLEVPQGRCWRATLAETACWVRASRLAPRVALAPEGGRVGFPERLPEACSITVGLGEDVATTVVPAGSTEARLAMPRYAPTPPSSSGKSQTASIA